MRGKPGQTIFPICPKKRKTANFHRNVRRRLGFSTQRKGIDYFTAFFYVYRLNIIKVVFNMVNHLLSDFWNVFMKKSVLNTTFLSAVILGVSVLTGCQALRVHTIDLPQGTPITAERAKSLQIGMTPEQVLYVLGTPAMRTTLAPNRWDYIYDYTAGTDGKRAGKPDIKNASQYLHVYFDASGRVARIEGIDSLPAKAF